MNTYSTQRPPILYGIVAWMAINILLMVLIIVNGDYEDINNWIEIALWFTAVPALLSNKKWGFAFAIFVLTYTLSTSVSIIIYYQVWLNAVRFVNVFIIIYLFQQLFRGKVK